MSSHLSLIARARTWLGLSTMPQPAAAGLLWSKGIAALCDVHGPPDYAMAHTESVQDAAFFRTHFADAHGVVWVRLGTHARHGRGCDLDLFVEAALPHIRQPFALVTTDGDTTVPADLRPETVRALLESPHLRAWRTQNHDGFLHPKLGPFPIGLDLHSPRRAGDAEALARLIRRLRDRRPARRPARLEAFCDLHLTYSSGERISAVGSLRSCDHVVFPTRRMPQAALWRHYATYPFVLSAPGNGLDCHRTWEALYLGAIVIMKPTPLAPLFDGLPVAVADHWAQAGDPARLKAWMDTLGPLTARDNVYARLDARRWIAALRGVLD